MRALRLIMGNATDFAVNASTFYCPIAKDIWLANVIMYFITLIVGLVGNILALLIVVKRKRKRTENDIFIANLAISDLALLLFFLPAKLYAYLTCSQKVHFAAFCTLIFPMSVLTFSTSIFTMTAMSVHRCRHIVKPFLGPTRKIYTYVSIAVIWIFSITMILPLMIFTKFDPKLEMCKEQFPSLEVKKVYTAVLFVLQCAIPLFIISAAYFLIWRDLSKSTVHRASINSRGRVTTDCSRTENRQVVRTIAAIVVLFVLCTFPTQVAWMAMDFGDIDAQQAAFVIFTFSDILALFHSCVNPIVYGSLTRHFRRGYYRYLCYCHVICTNNTNTNPFSETGSFSRGSSKSSSYKAHINARDKVTKYDSLVCMCVTSQRPVSVVDDVIDVTKQSTKNVEI